MAASGEEEMEEEMGEMEEETEAEDRWGWW